MATLKNKTIVVGITGGIAAYKSCDLVRGFVKKGARVHVILTEAAVNFVTPLTLQTLSKNPVHCEIFSLLQTNVNHISLSDMADALVVAPACANTIAKVAHGICDDLLSTTICATNAPVIFAPSMNVKMWENPITKENVARLKKLKYHFIDPDVGELACGYRGVGRMADINAIIANVQRYL